MKKISISELVNIMGGYSYSSCEEVHYAAVTHRPPSTHTEEEEDAEDDFWDTWYNEYYRLCVNP